LMEVVSYSAVGIKKERCVAQRSGKPYQCLLQSGVNIFCKVSMSRQGEKTSMFSQVDTVGSIDTGRSAYMGSMMHSMGWLRLLRMARLLIAGSLESTIASASSIPGTVITEALCPSIKSKVRSSAYGSSISIELTRT